MQTASSILSSLLRNQQQQPQQANLQNQNGIPNPEQVAIDINPQPAQAGGGAGDLANAEDADNPAVVAAESFCTELLPFLLMLMLGMIFIHRTGTLHIKL